jgi:Family of unknown function (DUF5681)
MPSDDVGNNAQTTGKQHGGITGKGFMPGRSGNPTGRPRRLPITDRDASIAELPAPDYLLAALELSEAEKQEIKTYGDALAISQFRAGIKGKTEAAREIADRVEGKARQSVDVSGDITVGLAERIERARKADEAEEGGGEEGG